MTEDPGVGEAVRKAFERLLPEGGVADGGDLVDQVPVEGDPHRHAEGEPRLHARGVGAHRHVHELAELGEVVDEVDHRLGVHAVDPRDEAHVLRAGQVGVEAAGEAERPGDRAMPADLARGRADGAGDHAEQRRLAGAVAPEHADLGPRRAAPGSDGRAPPCGRRPSGSDLETSRNSIIAAGGTRGQIRRTGERRGRGRERPAGRGGARPRAGSAVVADVVVDEQQDAPAERQEQRRPSPRASRAADRATSPPSSAGCAARGSATAAAPRPRRRRSRRACGCRRCWRSRGRPGAPRTRRPRRAARPCTPPLSIPSRSASIRLVIASMRRSAWTTRWSLGSA